MATVKLSKKVLYSMEEEEGKINITVQKNDTVRVAMVNNVKRMVFYSGVYRKWNDEPTISETEK